MPVVVLRLPPASLARLESGKYARSESADDQDGLPMTKKRKPLTMVLKLPPRKAWDGYGNMVVPGFRDSNHARSVAEDIRLIPFVSTYHQSRKELD
jgi:hypothetical protein